METWRKGDFFQYHKLVAVPISRRKDEFPSLRRSTTPLRNVPIIHNGQVPVYTSCQHCRAWLDAFAVIEDGRFTGIDGIRSPRRRASGSNRIVDDLQTETRFAACSICKRRILVQIAMTGISHNLALTIVCAACVRRRGVDSRSRREDPRTARRIEAWARQESDEEKVAVFSRRGADRTYPSVDIYRGIT